MSLLRDQAVVLRRLDYSETSQVVVLFGREHGKLRLIAKGIKKGTKKRFAAAMDLLEEGEVVWSAPEGRAANLMTLTEWQQSRGFAGLREALSRLYAAQYAAEVTSEVLEDGDPHPGLFDELVALLERLSTAGSLAHLANYQKALLNEIGLLPQLAQCGGCRRALEHADHEWIYFSSHQGACLCRDCEAPNLEKRRLAWSTVQALRGDEVPESAAAAVFDILDYHLAHIIGKAPRLSEFVIPSAHRTLVGG